MMYVVTTFLLMQPLVLLFYFIGLARGRATERAKKPEPIRPICLCTHMVSSHRDGGQCQAELRRSRYDGGIWIGYQYVKCECTKYHGPIVVTEEFFHPGVIAQ